MLLVPCSTVRHYVHQIHLNGNRVLDFLVFQALETKVCGNFFNISHSVGTSVRLSQNQVLYAELVLAAHIT